MSSVFMGWTGLTIICPCIYVFSVKHWSWFKSVLTFRKRRRVVWFCLKPWAFSKLKHLCCLSLQDLTLSRVSHDNNTQCKISLQVKHSLNRLGYKMCYCSKVWVRYDFLKIFLTDVSYAFQECIYLIKNTSKYVTETTVENICFFFPEFLD